MELRFSHKWNLSIHWRLFARPKSICILKKKPHLKGSSVKINRCIKNKWNSLYFKFVLQFDENIFRIYCSKQARRQDSVTGEGGTENFGGHEKFNYVNSRGAQEVYSSMDQTKKVKTKKRKKGLRPKISTNSGCLKILAIFHEIWSEDQIKKGLRPKT